MSHPIRSRLLSLLAGALILILGIGGLLFTLVSVFSLDVYRPILLAGCVLCPLAFLAVFHLPRLRFLPLLGAAAGWAWALWRFWDVLVLGEISIRCSVVNTFAIHVPSISTIYPLADLPAETWTAAATLLALMAVIPLSALCAWALAGRRIPALFFWFTFLPLIPALCITQNPALPPLLALMTAWIAALLPARSGRRDRAGWTKSALILLPCCAGLLAALALLLPMESYQRPAWAEDARNELTAWAQRTFEGPLGGDGPGGLGGSRLADAGGGVDLSDAGPLQYSGRTVLRVTAPDLKGRVYLRGFSGALYEGDRWAPLPDGAYEVLSYEGAFRSVPPYSSIRSFSSLYLDPWSVRGEDDQDPPAAEAQEEDGGAESPEPALLEGFQPMNFPALADRESFPSHDYAKFTIENVGADPGYVYYPYQILTTPEQLSGAQFVHDACLARAEDVWTHTLYLMPACSPTSGAQLPQEAQLPERYYAAFAAAHYMDVPPELTEVLWDCFSSIVSDPEHTLPGGWENEHYQYLLRNLRQEEKRWELEYAGLIADYLSVLTEYDPDTPATPEGEDFVSYFLTESRRGYCMHYASAATLMLRSLGIPARYVSGYVADMSGGKAAVPDSNAHAWVEVYLEGYGWEPVEVTPAYAGSTPGQSAAAAPKPTPSAAPRPTPGQSAAPKPTPTPTPTPAQANPGNTAAGPALDLRWLWIPGLCCAAALALQARRALGRLGRKIRFLRAGTNEAVLAVYRYLRRLDRWGADTDPVEAAMVEALAQKARFSQHTLTGLEREAALSAARRTARELDQKLPLWKRFAFRYLWGLY